MRTSRWMCALAVLALAGCATQKAEVQPQAKGPALTPEAQQMLDRALSREDASGVMVDLAAMEEVGLGRPAETLKRTLQLLDSVLPWLVADEDNPEDQQFFGRLTVAMSVLREWTEWPNVRGFAISVPDVAEAAQTGEAPVGKAVAVVAVAQPEAQNRHLLEGVLALGRAALAEEHGKEVRFEVQGTDACIVETGSTPFCLRPGNGYLLMGSPEAMTSFQSAHTVAAAGGGETGDLTLLRARLSMRQQGSADVVLHGRETLTLAANLDSPSPVLLARAEQTVNEFLTAYDKKRALQRQVIGEALKKMQTELAADAQAPADMKQIAATLTPEKVLDPHGWWQQTRASVKSQRSGTHYALSLTVPAGAVDELEQMMEHGGGSAATALGMVGAIAVPNFMKFQCRAKQAEAKSNLKGIFVQQRAYAAEKNRYATTFRALGFSPEPGSRYTYCMGEDCISCKGTSCQEGAPRENPCAGMSGVGRTVKEGFQVCAYGNLDSDPAFDTWVVDDRGEPEQGENDCAD